MKLLEAVRLYEQPAPSIEWWCVVHKAERRLLAIYAGARGDLTALHQANAFARGWGGDCATLWLARRPGNPPRIGDVV